MRDVPLRFPPGLKLGECPLHRSIHIDAGLHQNQPTQQALDAGLAGSDVGDETRSEEICGFVSRDGAFAASGYNQINNGGDLGRVAVAEWWLEEENRASPHIEGSPGGQSSESACFSSLFSNSKFHGVGYIRSGCCKLAAGLQFPHILSCQNCTGTENAAVAVPACRRDAM
jgi:hypothetical protein